MAQPIPSRRLSRGYRFQRRLGQVTGGLNGKTGM
jgi:hypothetical protein